MIDLKDKVILTTGSSSMIGKSVILALKKRGAIIPEHQSIYYNLLSYADTQQLFYTCKPDYVIHCAGFNGNIAFNGKFPSEIFYKTSKMALNVLGVCSEFEVKKVVSVISSCAIAERNDDLPLRAEDLHSGPPNPTVECHGYSKRILDIYSRQLNKEFGLNAVCVILTNCYGPNDSFKIEKTKVVAGLIKRFVEAKQQNLSEVVCWGSGNVYRELMYSEDAGEAIVQSLEKYENVSIPLCIGTGVDISIKELTEEIAKIIGYTGNIIWDINKPDGQKRKLLESSRMRESLNVPITPFHIALQKTIEWYITNQEKANKR